MNYTIKLNKLISKIESNNIIPFEAKVGIIERLKKAYEIFGKEKYIENFLSTFQEALNRYRHFDIIAWSIVSLNLTVSFALVGYLLSISHKMSSFSLLISLVFAYIIGFFGYLYYVRIYEHGLTIRKYIYIIEEIFGYYFLLHQRSFIVKNLIVNDKLSKAIIPKGIFSIKTFLFIFEIIYFIFILLLILVKYKIINL